MDKILEDKIQNYIAKVNTQKLSDEDIDQNSATTALSIMRLVETQEQKNQLQNEFFLALGDLVKEIRGLKQNIAELKEENAQIKEHVKMLSSCVEQDFDVMGTGRRLQNELVVRTK